jgi:hypothetical protein
MLAMNRYHTNNDRARMVGWELWCQHRSQSSPLRGASFALPNPGLALWVVIFRRFAAGGRIGLGLFTLSISAG